MEHSDEKLRECGRIAAPSNSKEHRQQKGFIRAFARELLVHNPAIQTIDDALKLAEDFTLKTWDDTHSHCRTDHDPSME